jgi:hypothetical protein
MTDGLVLMVCLYGLSLQYIDTTDTSNQNEIFVNIYIAYSSIIAAVLTINLMI